MCGLAMGLAPGCPPGLAGVCETRDWGESISPKTTAFFPISILVQKYLEVAARRLKFVGVSWKVSEAFNHA